MAQEKWVVEGPKVIDVELVRRLKVGLVAGKVDIVGHDEPGARIEVHSVSGKELRISIDGDELEIDHPQVGWENILDVFRSFKGSIKADISVMVPREVALKLSVVSATALVTGLHDDASLNTVSGDAVIDGLAGDVALHTVSGELAVRNHYGKVSARTISGDITAHGDIFAFASDAVSGDVFLDITGTPDQVRVNSVSGDVTVRLAPGVPAQYRINTVSGKLQLDDSQVTGVKGNFTGRYGELDKSFLEFRASTVSGDISVLHAVTA